MRRARTILPPSSFDDVEGSPQWCDEMVPLEPYTWPAPRTWRDRLADALHTLAERVAGR